MNRSDKPAFLNLTVVTLTLAAAYFIIGAKLLTRKDSQKKKKKRKKKESTAAKCKTGPDSLAQNSKTLTRPPIAFFQVDRGTLNRRTIVDRPEREVSPSHAAGREQRSHGTSLMYISVLFKYL